MYSIHNNFSLIDSRNDCRKNECKSLKKMTIILKTAVMKMVAFRRKIQIKIKNQIWYWRKL